MIRAPRLAENLGISYRQLDHWRRKGYVPASHYAKGGGMVSPRRITGRQDGDAYGSGWHMLYDDEAQSVARRFAELRQAGFDASTADYIRRRMDGETPADRPRDLRIAAATGVVLAAIEPAAREAVPA